MSGCLEVQNFQLFSISSCAISQSPSLPVWCFRLCCGQALLLSSQHVVHVWKRRSLLLLLLPALLTQTSVLHGQAERLGAQHVQLLRLQPQQVALALCHSCELVFAGYYLPYEVCWAQYSDLLEFASQTRQMTCTKDTKVGTS